MDIGKLAAFALPTALLLMGFTALLLRDLWRKNRRKATTLIYHILLVVALLAFAAGMFLINAARGPRLKPTSQPGRYIFE